MQGLWARGTARYPVGTNVFDRDWDVLVLLDTCRVDALRDVAPEYAFLGEVRSIRSVGSTSAEWLANTFRRSYADEIADTALVSSNAYTQAVVEDRTYRGGTDHVVEADAFALLDQPWRYAPDDAAAPFHTPPRYVTDRAIEVARSVEPDRLVVHYRPPHAPYTANAVAEGRDLRKHEKQPFEALQDGVAFEAVWSAYLDELRCGLDEVEILLRSIDADRVVVSADHGEAFGEWGVYRHPMGWLHPVVRRVPWAITSASDTGSYDPQLTRSLDEIDAPTDVADRLDALGYHE